LGVVVFYFIFVWSKEGKFGAESGKDLTLIGIFDISFGTDGYTAVMY